MTYAYLEGSLADNVLIDQARMGQLDAYSGLVLRYQALAYGVAQRMLGNSDAAADATQDSFLKAYNRLHQYRGGGTAFRSWLMRIVVNTCYDSLRSMRRQTARLVSIDQDSGDGKWNNSLQDPGEQPEEYVLRREIWEGLQAAIDWLPVDQRTVLILSDIEGLPYEEIASIIRTPVGTVKSRLSRARARVRNTIHAKQPGLTRERRASAPRLASAPRASSSQNRLN